MPKLSLIFFASLVLNFCLITAQTNNAVYNKLVKRYGNVTPWGKGYVIKVKSLYGFADKNGHLVISIDCARFDSLLPNRANISYSSWGCALINENGQVVAHGDGLYYYLLNRQSRLMAMRLRDNTEKFCNDNGEDFMRMTYDARMPKQKLIGANIYVKPNYFCGINNFGGDTILPARYNSIGYNNSNYPGLYCGIRNDTAYVFSNKQLLFTMAKVHHSFGINGNFISLGKYGVYALINRSGKLLTPFKYTYIEALHFADSIIQLADENHLLEFKESPNYFITHNFTGKGIIDSSGHELLPTLYENIILNSNGWLILQKKGHTREELVNARFEKVLEAEAGSINFVTNRYVKIQNALNTSQQGERVYDMQLQKFSSIKISNKKKSIEAKEIKKQKNYYHEPKWKNDTLQINSIGSRLYKKNGRWGITSFTGDVILPFIFDTTFIYGAIYVGKKGNFSPIDWEGNLIYPAELNELPQYWSATDSIVITKNNIIYSYKSWHLKKTEPSENGVKDFYLHYENGIAYAYGNTPSKRGLYNRRMKKLADKPYRYAGSPMIRATGIVAIEDSVNKMVAAVDSTGRFVIPWIKESVYFMVREHYAVAFGDTAKPDILYRFENGTTLRDTIWIDSRFKSYIVKDRERFYGPDDRWALSFEKRGFCKGILSNKPVVMIKGAERMDFTWDCVRIKIDGKWGLYEYERKQLLAPDYDSIERAGFDFRLLKKNGKYGFFDIPCKLLIEPAYDSVCYQSSYVMQYFIGYNNGVASIVNRKGRVISGGWQNMKPSCQYSMENLIGSKNGINYKLYPSLGDSLLAIPEGTIEPKVELLKTVENFDDGFALMTDNEKTGVLYESTKKIVIPAKYKSIERVNDYFFATTPSPEALHVYSPEAVLMFTLNGTYYDPTSVNQNQWHIWGSNGYMIVNSKGKIIVPPVYKNIQALSTNGPPVYLIENQAGKYGLIDTSGKILTKPLFDNIGDETFYNGYRSATLNNKTGVLSPAGQLIVPCIYKTIEAGNTEENCLSAIATKVDEPYFIVSNTALKYGIVNKSGKPVIPCIYAYIQQVEAGNLFIANKGGYSGLVSISGNTITAFKYDYINNFNCGRAAFRRGDVMGYLLPDGKEIIEE